MRVSFMHIRCFYIISFFYNFTNPRLNRTVRECMSTDHVSPRVSSLLLTQLLEGIVHCTSHGVAHRDLKTDNLLLDESCHGHCPRLLITDFGSCLADSRWGLKLPFITVETDRGGNVRLMAPEVTWMTVHSPLITWNHGFSVSPVILLVQY